MSPRHFSRMMQSPYFHTDHYSETKEGKLERKIEEKFNNAIYRIKKKLFFKNH